MNRKSEDCYINQNLKSGKKKYMGGGRRMSLLRAPKSTADLGSILQWHPGVAAAGYQQPWVQGKASPTSAVTQGACKVPEAMTDTWASTPLASYQLHKWMFNPTISPEPCLVKKENRWTASNLWQHARRIAGIGSWCILMPLLLVIMTTYSSRFLNHGKGYALFFFLITP